MSKERFKIIPGLYAVLLKNRQVLLLRRHNTGFEDGKFSLPGGHLDENESYKNAMIRETKEEIGVILDSDTLQVAHAMHRKQNGDRLDLFFVSDRWNGDPKITEPEKCDDLRWFPINALPDNIVPYVKQAIDCIIKNEFYSEFGW